MMYNFWALTVLFAVAAGFHYSPGSNNDEDQVKILPGLQENVTFRQYSGYLNASDGKFLHYWFVESQRDPDKDPLLLWLNGGPGCSSLDGFLTELGPFRVKKDGKTLYMNEFSWNKIANVLFLESPAGVGFSYSLSKKYDTDDDIVASDNYLALQHFFYKFPHFKKNDFYITGESYAGIYIPTLSDIVLTGPANINFKGFAIGNGYLDVNKLGNSVIFFANYHGLIDEPKWEVLTEACCHGSVTKDTCNFVQPSNPTCMKAVEDVNLVIGSSGLNGYNMYADCATSSSGSSRDSVDKANLFRAFSFMNKETSSLPCIDSSSATAYLNQKSVRKAIHVPDNVQEWEVCSSLVEGGYRRIYNRMQPQIMKLLESKKLKGLIYNGDVDMVCNFLGDEWFTEDLGLPVRQEYQPWYFNNQVAGFYKIYEDLVYLTIKGSGHMVPEDKPGPAFKMISSFLFNKPY